MNINFTLCDADEIREDLKKLEEFKNRWFELLTGWRDINDDERDLERSQAILRATLVLENLLYDMENEEEVKKAKERLNIKN